MCHSWCDSTRRSDKAFGARNSIFHQRLRSTDGDQLILSRFGAAVPWFAEERDAYLGSRRQAKLRSGQFGRSVSSLPDAFECSCPRLFLALRLGSGLLYGLAESVESRVGA